MDGRELDGGGAEQSLEPGPVGALLRRTHGRPAGPACSRGQRLFCRRAGTRGLPRGTGLRGAPGMGCGRRGGDARRSRSWVPAAKVAAVSLAAALCSLVTYLPGYLASAVTWRVLGAAGIVNVNLFTAPWSESLDAVIPTALPAIQGFSHSQVQQAPVSYIAWFILPVLAFVDWGRARRLIRELAGPLMILVVMLVVTAGPSHLGPIRWPARMLPFVAAAVLVLIGVLLSRAVSLSG